MSDHHAPENLQPAATKGHRILLLSAYEAHSHRQWRSTLCDMFPEHQWTCLSLPPRHFAWRVRGNSLSWAFNHRQTLTDNYDLLIVTSLTDLSSLRGFVPELARLPTLVYFHENQFAYPVRSSSNAGTAAPETGLLRQSNLVNAQLTSLYTALCADRIVFNSDWNRCSFFAGLGALLSKLPDEVPTGLLQQLQNISSVLAVPLPDHLYAGNHQNASDAAHLNRPDDTLQIVWNHRHEYDKGPALLLAIVQQLISRGLRFRLHLLGQRFRRAPEEFDHIRTLLTTYYREQCLLPGVDGWMASRDDYELLLSTSDIVLSTAQHDFQGLSVLEAVARGCVPLTPDDLAYPEYIDAACLFPVAGLTTTEQATAACATIIGWARQWQDPDHTRPASDVNRFRATAMRSHWAGLLESLAAT
ncbi:MAG: glycosyl transferase family 1 [Gammaproteobacteria bacterium]|nr:glycosyl transferase family 1 [Gammaproteobacteria bacterium]|tara:strand:- start:1268 stop:2512 length:1245 start_codon:yes stop_codon:yes gene_type:complete